MVSQPSLFLSHGAPDLLLSGHPVLRQFAGLAATLRTPRAVLVISAHWIANRALVTASPRPGTIHDFYGFPDALYQLDYPASGDTDLAHQVVGLLEAGGISAATDPRRGLDHGAWVPLMALWPKPSIPVVQVSLSGIETTAAITLGRVLSPLRQQGILILGSGGSVHNLGAIEPKGETAPWASRFSDWLTRRVEQGSLSELSDLQHYPAEFAQAHPTIEHYLPLLTAWAAADPKRPGRRITNGFQYANIGLDGYRFD